MGKYVSIWRTFPTISFLSKKIENMYTTAPMLNWFGSRKVVHVDLKRERGLYCNCISSGNWRTQYRDAVFTGSSMKDFFPYPFAEGTSAVGCFFSGVLFNLKTAMSIHLERKRTMNWCNHQFSIGKFTNWILSLWWKICKGFVIKHSDWNLNVHPKNWTPGWSMILWILAENFRKRSFGIVLSNLDLFFLLLSEKKQIHSAL